MENAHRWVTPAIGLLALPGLYAVSLFNGSLGQELAAIFVIGMGGGVIATAWNCRRSDAGRGLLVLALAGLLVAIAEVVHALTSPGMGLGRAGGMSRSALLVFAGASLPVIGLLSATLVGSRAGFPRISRTLLVVSLATMIAAGFLWTSLPLPQDLDAFLEPALRVIGAYALYRALAEAFVERSLVAQDPRDDARWLALQAQELARANAELAACNTELEAFSSSVSHDLRAPLGIIDGCSRLLMEDYGNRLDPEGLEYLQVVRSATSRMNELIEDLLKLSRINRSDLKVAPVDLSELAFSVACQFQRAQPAREVQFVIAPDIRANGDPRLLAIAFENLIGNSWKFTSKRPGARIEFGVRDGPASREYFVRDNGAGFDMRQAQKLFAPFQRLHNPLDFPGTGIGLATVQRIIHRHGGTLRGEGEPGKGACFSFTLQTG